MTMVDVAGSGEAAERWMGLEPLGTSELGRSGAGRLPRRGAMGLGLAGLAAALPGTVAGAPQAHVSVPVQGTGIDTLDERFKAIIPDPNVLIERVAGGFRFVEGPVWVDNSVLFVDNNLDTIFRYRDTVWGPEITLFRYPGGTNIDEQRPPGVGGPGPNGLALDKVGRLLVTEHGNRRITRTEPDGRLTVLTTTYQGKRFNSPNDMAVRSDNTIYFTDPPYGLAMQTWARSWTSRASTASARTGRSSWRGRGTGPTGYACPRTRRACTWWIRWSSMLASSMSSRTAACATSASSPTCGSGAPTGGRTGSSATRRGTSTSPG